MKGLIIILGVVLMFFLFRSCSIPTYSDRYFIVVDKVSKDKYIAKMRVGEWVEAKEITQDYEEWFIGDTIYYTKYKPFK